MTLAEVDEVIRQVINHGKERGYTEILDFLERNGYDLSKNTEEVIFDFKMRRQFLLIDELEGYPFNELHIRLLDKLMGDTIDEIVF